MLGIRNGDWLLAYRLQYIYHNLFPYIFSYIDTNFIRFWYAQSGFDVTVCYIIM